MEAKTKNRILGALVVVGLVIILFPFFQGEGDKSPTASLVQAPPFPDEPVQVTADAEATPEAAPVITPETTMTASSQPVADSQSLPIQSQTQGEVNQQPDDTINTSNNNIENVKIPDLNTTQDDQNKTDANNVAASNPATEISATTESVRTIDLKPTLDTDATNIIPQNQPATDVAAKSEEETAAKPPLVTKPKSTARTAVQGDLTKPHPYNANKTLAANDSLVKLKGSAWVIQVGTFKNKANALRLVNQLRSSGYRAFIKDGTSSFGDSTRVFVGPEVQQVAAKELATRLESDLNLHGMVISYKPLDL